MDEIVLALLGGKFPQKFADAIPQTMDRSLRRLTEQGFQFREDHLNGVQIRGIRGQIQDRGPGFLDRRSDPEDLVNRQIVHDDQVTRRQCGSQYLVDVCEERRPVHRAIEHHRRGDRLASQRRDEGRGFSVPVRCFARQSLSFWRPAARTRHVRGGRRFIDEQELVRIQRGLIDPPGLASGFYVRPVLFGGVKGFF